MPYRRSGSKVLHKKAGKWKVKQTCSSPAAAKKAMSLLRGLEHGTIKKSAVGKGKFAKKKRKRRVAGKKRRKRRK